MTKFINVGIIIVVIIVLMVAILLAYKKKPILKRAACAATWSTAEEFDKLKRKQEKILGIDI